MGKNERSSGRKVLSILAKIFLALLVICILGYLVTSFMAQTQEDPWAKYYASLAQLGFAAGILIMLIGHVACNFRTVWAATKEMLRKFIVMLKRNPSLIPLAMMLVSFLLFSLNLTDMSDSTAKIQGKGMGLSQFCIMLFSLLSMVCMLNAFPRRKKPNIPMIVLMFAMFGIIIYCDIHYCNAIIAALYRAESPIIIDNGTLYIAYAYNMLNTHMVLVGVSAGLVALLPLYSKLLRKIKTSVEVESNDDMAAIEISE